MKNKLQIIVSFTGLFIAIVSIITSLYMVENKSNAEYIEEPKEISTVSKSNDEFVPVMSGWIKTNKSNIMESPSESSEVIDTLYFSDKILYTSYNKEWHKINIDGKDAYISSNHISNHELESHYYEVPESTGFKSFMDYDSITAVDSLQYEIQNSYATTGNYGIRMIDNRYCIALGSHFSNNIGQYVDLILKNGTVIPCILSDQKDDIHTDYNNIVTIHNGCLSEFIVDINSLDKNVLKHGNISYCCDEWDSPIVSVKVYDKNLFY